MIDTRLTSDTQAKIRQDAPFSPTQPTRDGVGAYLQ